MKKIKIILFDIDNIFIRLPHYFSKELEKIGYKNVSEILNPFYNGGDNYQCLEGKADANRMIMPYLNKFGWEETSENYFKQQFNFESNYLDNKLILLVRKIQAKRIKCYLCTDQDENRTKFLLNEMGFGNIFDGYFISYQIGYRKCNDNFWMHVIEKLKKDYQNIKPDEIVFFDDIQKNIDTASRIGIKTFLFKDTAQFEKDLNSVCM